MSNYLGRKARWLSMTGSTAWVGGRETGRSWLVRHRQKEFGKKNSSDDILPRELSYLRGNRSQPLARRRTGFREWLSPLSGRHQSLQRWFVVNDQGSAL